MKYVFEMIQDDWKIDYLFIFQTSAENSASSSSASLSNFLLIFLLNFPTVWEAPGSPISEIFESEVENILF